MHNFARPLVFKGSKIKNLNWKFGIYSYWASVSARFFFSTYLQSVQLLWLLNPVLQIVILVWLCGCETDRPINPDSNSGSKWVNLEYFEFQSTSWNQLLNCKNTEKKLQFIKTKQTTTYPNSTKYNNSSNNSNNNNNNNNNNQKTHIQ